MITPKRKSSDKVDDSFSAKKTRKHGSMTLNLIDDRNMETDIGSGTFERMRFVNSGTEAVMTMIKTARVYTKKTKIAKAEGAYHGTYDYAEMSQTSNPSNWGNINKPNTNPVVEGTPQGALNDVIIFPYNDIERTLNILDQYADEIACVLIDPVPHRVGLFPATDAFIEAIYKWTRKNDALMAFDEVVTYRVNYAGAQENYTFKPDLTAMGKIIGGGFPIGALAGTSEIMEVLDPRGKILRHPHSGTFSANPISTTAGRVAMELFDEEAVLNLNTLTETAIHQIEESIKIADVPISITGAGSMFRLHLQEKKPTCYREAYHTDEKKSIIKELLDYLFMEEQSEEQSVRVNDLSILCSNTVQFGQTLHKGEEFLSRGLSLFQTYSRANNSQQPEVMPPVSALASSLLFVPPSTALTNDPPTAVRQKPLSAQSI